MNALLDTYQDAPAYFRRALLFNGMKELLPDGTLEPRVRALFEHTRFPAKMVNTQTAWCAAFWCAMLEREGLKSPHSAAADSFSTFGLKCSPRVGAFVVIPREGGRKHVTCWAGQAGSQFLGFGGNQRNSVCMQLYDSIRIEHCRFPAELV